MNLINTIQTVGRFTNSAVISPDKTYFGDLTQSYFGVVEVDPGAISSEIGLYEEIANLSRMAALFEDPDVTVEGRNLKLVEGDAEAYFITSDISLIKGREYNLEDQITKTKDAPKVLILPFNPDLIQKITKAEGTIDNASLIVVSAGGKVFMELKDIDILSSDSNSFKIECTPTTTNKEFKIELDPSIIRRMPRGTFTMEVCYSERVGSYRVVFHQEELYVVASCNEYTG